MTNEIMKTKKRVTIPPLQMRYPDERPYYRRSEVQKELERLYEIPIEEVANRAGITDLDNSNYISSEAVLHFVRRSQINGDTAPYGVLFMKLRQRILRALPVVNKRILIAKIADDPYQREVRNRVVDKLTEMLCRDRTRYLKRLDYFEVMFNSALCRLRQTAKRDTSKRVELEKNEPLIIDEAVSDKEDNFGGVLENLNEPANSENFVYRFELLSAINLLPDDERRVIELLIQRYLLREVAEIVGIDVKTARTRRNRARAVLAEALDREDLL